MERSLGHLKNAFLRGFNVLAVMLAAFALFLVQTSQVEAVDRSTSIEAGAHTINATDTMIVDNTNDGNGSTSVITFAAAGARSLAITSTGADAQAPNDTAQFASFVVGDDNNTSTLTFSEDTTGTDAMTYIVTGNISGDVATDANDLDIIMTSLATNDGDTVMLKLAGNVDMGAGTITMTGDANDVVTLVINGAADQAFEGAILSTTDDTGSVINIQNGANTLTFATTVGQACGGIGSILIGNAGSTQAAETIFNAAVDAAVIDMDSDGGAMVVDFNAAVVGASWTIESGASSGDTATVKFAADVTLTALNIQDQTGLPTIIFDGAVAQTVVGNITGTACDKGVLTITNTHNDGVLFTDDVGVAGNGLSTLNIAAGSKMTVSTGTATDALTFDFNGNVSSATGSSTKGGELVLKAGTATACNAGSVFTLATITGTTKLTTLTIIGGTGVEDDNGGAFTSAVLTGASDITTLNIVGGAGQETTVAAKGSDGGAVVTFLQTGTIDSTTINITGGAGGKGDDNVTQDGGDGGAISTGGSTTFDGLITAPNFNLSGGAGGAGGAAGSANTGGVGGTGGAALVTDLDGGVTGAITIKGGNGGDGGLGNACSKLGGNGGVGGLATLSSLDTGGALTNVTITAGLGGTGGDSGVANGGAGGAGGTTVVTLIDDAVDGNVLITGGMGGVAGSGVGAGNGGAGGAGTAIATVVFDDDIAGTVTITSGSGGNGGTNGVGCGDGGIGGNGGNVAVSINGDVAQWIALDDGNAGTTGVDSGAGDGGAGGNASTVTLTFADQAAVQVVTGAVTAAADGEGAIVINNNQGTTADVTFSTIGTSSKALKSLTVSDGDVKATGDVYIKTITAAASDLFDFNGDVTAATTITLITGSNAKFAADVTASTNFEVTCGVATIELDGAVDQLITGVISADAAARANVTNSNATGIVTFANDIGELAGALSAATITGATGSQSVFNGKIYAGAVTTVGTAKMTFADTVILSGQFTTTDLATITLGSTFVGGTTVLTSVNSHCSLDQTVDTVTLVLNSKFTSGVVKLIDDSATLDTDDADSFKVTNTALTSYAMGIDSGDVIITATAKSAAATASELGISTAAASSLMNANTAAAGDAAVLSLMSAILTTGGAAATEMAEQLQGSPDGLAATSGAATASAGAAVISVGSSRMAALRTGDAYVSTAYFTPTLAQNNTQHGTGFNAGSGAQSSSMWMKPFASFGDQGLRDSIKGYEADTYGLAVGADTRLNAHSIVGFGFSYADTDVDGKGAGRSHSDIKSYQLTAYADYTEKDWYVEGLVGYAYNDMDTTRDITVTSAKAKGDTESDQYMVSVNAGMPMKVDAEGLPGAYFTPTLGMSFTLVDNKDYTETGAGVLNLKVSPEDITIAKASLGGRLHASVETSDGIFVPELRAKLMYDMAGDDGSSSNTFTGGGAAFNVDGQTVEQFATSAGVGFAFMPTFSEMEGMSFSVNYDAEFKDDFTGQSGSFNVRYAF